MKKILLILSVVIVVAIIAFTTLRNDGTKEVRTLFEEHYPQYEVKEIYNTRGFGEGKEYVVEYEYQGLLYRGWLEPNGEINEKEKIER